MPDDVEIHLSDDLAVDNAPRWRTAIALVAPADLVIENLRYRRGTRTGIDIEPPSPDAQEG